MDALIYGAPRLISYIDHLKVVSPEERHQETGDPFFVFLPNAVLGGFFSFGFSRGVLRFQEFFSGGSRLFYVLKGFSSVFQVFWVLFLVFSMASIVFLAPYFPWCFHIYLFSNLFLERRFQLMEHIFGQG